MLQIRYAILLCSAFTRVVDANPPAGTLNIPLTVNQEQRYVVGVNMSYVPSTQKFKFVMAMNTGYSAVAGTSCTNCNGVPSYNSSLSTSEQALNGSQSVNFGQASVSGPLIKEDCGLQQNNGSSWLYPNQTIIVANSSSSLFSDVTSGLFGLGTNANGANGNFFDTVFGGFLARNPDQNNFTFGMDLKAPTFTSEDDTGNGGVLHWLVPDVKAYDASNVTWATASVSSAQANAGTSNDTSATTPNSNSQFVLPESDWAIEIDEWAVIISGATAVANATKVQAVVEPFFPNIYFPAAQANLLYATIPSATKLDSPVSNAQSWSIPCDTQMALSFTISGQSFQVNQSSLVQQQSDGSCIGTVQAWPDSTVSDILLGSNFISNYYLIYVVGAPGSGVPNSIGWANKSATSSSSKTNVGAIIGGTMGGVAFASVIAIIIFIFWRRREQRRHTAAMTATTTSMSSGRYTSSPLASGTKEKFEYGQNEEQYVVNTLPHSGRFTTPPPSGRSANGFLPEAHTPQTPSFSIPQASSGSHPFSRNSATNLNLLALSTASAPGSSHQQEGSAFSVGSRISYNSPALAANRPQAQQPGSPSASPGSHKPVPGLGQFNEESEIEPFIMPLTNGQGPAPPPSRASEKYWMTEPLSSAQRGYGVAQEQAEPLSPRDLDPLSPSTMSTGAAVVSLVLPAPSGVDANASRRERKASGGAAAPMRVVNPPAPPYTALAATVSPVSPTLVDSGASDEHSPL